MSFSKYFGKRNLSDVSNSSVSDASPATTEKKKKQEGKKPRRENLDKTFSVSNESDEDTNMQSTLEDIKERLEKLATKDDISELRDEISRVTTKFENRLDQLESLVFDLRTEKDVLDAELKTMRQENKDLKDKIEGCVKADESLKRDLNDQEQHGRQFNLRVYGVPETGQGKDTVEDSISRCIGVFSKLKVPVKKDDVEIAHRTGKPGGARPRPIIIRFHSRVLRGQVLAERRRLKQTGLSVGEDLTWANYQLLRRASQHSATMAAWSSNGKVLVKVKNGKVVRLDIGMNVDSELTKAMK